MLMCSNAATVPQLRVVVPFSFVVNIDLHLRAAQRAAAMVTPVDGRMSMVNCGSHGERATERRDDQHRGAP